MNTSLTKFCKDHDLPKSTVHRRCQELRIDTSDGLVADDYDRLLHEFDIAPSEPEPEPETTALSVEVKTGNHQMVVPTPEMPSGYSLEKLRSREASFIKDPLEVATKFLKVADSLTNAMHSDIEVRQQRLDQTKQAKEQIEKKASELSLESRFYKMQTSQLDKAVSEETSALQNALELLQTLGKPSPQDS